MVFQATIKDRLFRDESKGYRNLIFVHMVFLYNSDYKRLIRQYDKRNIGKAKNISQRLWEYEKEYSVTSNQKWSALYTDFLLLGILLFGSLCSNWRSGYNQTDWKFSYNEYQ